MRILHTSDLHLGHRSRGGHARWDDQARILDEILAICQDHTVDMLLITGDLFSNRLPPGIKVEEIAYRFLKKIQPNLERGMAVFVVQGNHDPADLFRLMRWIITQMNGQLEWPLVVADEVGAYKIPGHNLRVLALPYLTRNMLQTEPVTEGTAYEQLLVGQIGKLGTWLSQLRMLDTPEAPARLPTIFAGHILVRGAQVQSTETEVEMGFSQELTIEANWLPEITSYNALGHIHLSQKVSGTAKPTWYAGVPERLDLGEREYTPQVLLVTTPDQPGGVANVVPIPLTTCTSFIQEHLVDIDAVDTFCRRIGTEVRANPLGRVTVAVPPEWLGEVRNRIHLVAPRLDIEYAYQTEIQPVNEFNTINYYDVVATVRSYITQRTPNPEKQERLLAAFSKLLEVGKS